MSTEGFVRSSLVTVFINPNASSPKIDLYLALCADEGYAVDIEFFMVHG